MRLRVKPSRVRKIIIFCLSVL